LPTARPNIVTCNFFASLKNQLFSIK
jgi:hypothetical protein